MLEKNSWVGLNAYSEGQKLLGRKEDVENIINLLLQKHFIVLSGNSGVGKTSLLIAGVNPIARKNKMLPIYVRLSYYGSLSVIEQIIQSIYSEVNWLSGEFQIKELYSIKDGAVETLQSFFQRHEIEDNHGQSITPLIVLDQFEEVFTLNRGNKAIYTEIFKQLDDAISYKYNERSAESPFYLIISIRESFLSFIDKNTDNRELRLNRFFLEDLNEEQAYEVITGNNSVTIDKRTSELIISQICGRTDFSINGIPEIYVPTNVLSLYMTMLYKKCTQLSLNTITEDLVLSYNPGTCFEQLYLEAIEGLSMRSIVYLEDMLLTSDGRRNNVSREDLLREGISENELEHLLASHVLKLFTYGDDIRVELAHDILCPIIKQRIEERELLRQLNEKPQLNPANRNIGVIQYFQNLFRTTAESNEDLVNKYIPHKEEYDIFISYRRVDGRDVARNIQQALKARGYKNIFFDYDSIQKGEFTKRIVDAIFSCTDFILVLSPKSMQRCTNDGDPVANEIRTALKYKKNIIPVTIDGKKVKWPRTFPEDLRFIKDLQFHDHKSDSYFEHSIDELCEKLTCKTV